MDTRRKIIQAAELPAMLAAGNWIAVAGAFDPLTLAQAERLAARKKEGRKLLAVVESDRKSEPLLGADARAALIASLRCVDAVVIASAAELRGCGFQVEEDLAADRQRTADFVNFVLQR